METDKEFLANQHAMEKDALFILKHLREFMERHKVEKSDFSRKNVVYWSNRADNLLAGIPEESITPPKPFKSLMVQLSEGALSNKL